MTPKELRRLMPKNAHDEQAARLLVALGADKLMPVLPEMLRLLQDHRSPVSNIYCEFFANNSEHFVTPIRDFLARTTATNLKNTIVTKIVVHWPLSALTKLTGTMQMLVTHTDIYNTDLVLIGLLHKHALSEPTWLRDWLEFKRDRLKRLSDEADQLANYISKSYNS